mmetsp:Transcript_66118/g.149256  ORF Transcript_66118/g.149256 Transcript_66118/m.149256 type:complete len:92 (+) Transcript_66118:2426-2701(+)
MVHELSGMLMTNNTLQVLDLTDCEINGYGVGGKGFNEHLERLIAVIQDGDYSGAFNNLRISENKRIPASLLKKFRDAAKPPLVIDFMPPKS